MNGSVNAFYGRCYPSRAMRDLRLSALRLGHPGKPRIWFGHGTWICRLGQTMPMGYGGSPTAAYDDWHAATATRALAATEMAGTMLSQYEVVPAPLPPMLPPMAQPETMQ